MAINSLIAYLPAGRMSANTGTRLPMRVKSASDNGTFAAWAMASKCSTAFVEPSSAITTVIAFSNASLLKISDGRMPFANRFTTAVPAS